VKRLGDAPFVVEFDAAGAVTQVATRREQESLLVARYER